MSRENTAEERRLVSKFVTDTATRLNMMKDTEVGYGAPMNGNMIVNYEGYNFLVEVTPLDDKPLMDTMKFYNHLFKHREK